MTQKEIDKLVDYISNKTDDTHSIYVGLTKDERSVLILRGDASNVAKAMFSSIANAEENSNETAKQLYSIIKDTLFNLFKYDDSFRSDFVRDMMIFCSTNNSSN